MPDVILSFGKFIEVYSSPEPMTFTKNVIRWRDRFTIIELYSYEIGFFLDRGSEEYSPPLIMSHIAYWESGLDAYLDFMQRMSYAIVRKHLIRRPAMFIDCLLDGNAMPVISGKPEEVRAFVKANLPLPISYRVYDGFENKQMTVDEYMETRND
jgi:hypothetical protein